MAGQPDDHEAMAYIRASITHEDQARNDVVARAEGVLSMCDRPGYPDTAVVRLLRDLTLEVAALRAVVQCSVTSSSDGAWLFTAATQVALVSTSPVADRDPLDALEAAAARRALRVPGPGPGQPCGEVIPPARFGQLHTIPFVCPGHLDADGICDHVRYHVPEVPDDDG